MIAHRISRTKKMSAHMLVVRNDSPVERLARIGSYIQRLRRRLGKLDGYCGTSAWQSCDLEDEVMIMIEFREDQRGEEALQRFSRDKLAVEEIKLSDAPADLTVFDLESSAGLRPSFAANGTYLSLSRRIASPGYGQELGLELDNIFGYLAIIPGYLGHLYGSHSTLRDRVSGLVLWSSQESYQRSLPDNPIYGIKLYRKIL